MVHDNVKEIATKKGLSLGEVERRSGLGTGAISKWKVNSPTLKSLQAVAKTLGVPVSRLIKE